MIEYNSLLRCMDDESLNDRPWPGLSKESASRAMQLEGLLAKSHVLKSECLVMIRRRTSEGR